MDIWTVIFRAVLVLATGIWLAKLGHELVTGIRDHYRRRRDDVQARVDASLARWSYLSDRRS